MSRLLPGQRTATFAVLAAMALAVLDAGMITVALPSLAADFHGPSDTILVVSAYQAALLVGLLPAAHIAGRLGERRVFAAGVGLFCAAALLCALAPSLRLLIAARILQGLGAAAIMALGIALLRETLGSDRLGSAVAWNALTVALCSAAGPTLGAALLSLASWRWLFLTGLPIGAAALLASRALPASPGGRTAIDWPSIALHAGAVILLVTAARLAAMQASLALASAALATPLLILLVRRGRHQAAPMFPADLLGRRAFAVQAGASVCCFVGQSIGLVALPFHLHAATSRDVLATGLIVTCWPLGAACASFVANRLAKRPDRASQCAAGGLLLAAGLALLAAVPASGSALAHVAGAALCGVGFGLFQLANNRTLLLAAPVERAAAAGGVQGSARLAGQTTGTLVMALAFASLPLAVAPRAGLALGAAFALAAALIATRAAKPATSHRPSRPPRPTIERGPTAIGGDNQMRISAST